MILSTESDAEGNFDLNEHQQLEFDIASDNTAETSSDCTICVNGANLTVSGGALDPVVCIGDGQCGVYTLQDTGSYTGLATQTNINDPDFIVESKSLNLIYPQNKFSEYVPGTF